jgi:hypothetical protein
VHGARLPKLHAFHSPHPFFGTYLKDRFRFCSRRRRRHLCLPLVPTLGTATRLLATGAVPGATSVHHPRQRPGNPGPRLCLIETRCYVAAHARGHNFEFGAPVKRQLVQGVGTTSSERALRKTGVPRRSYSMSSSILFIFSEHAHGVVERSPQTRTLEPQARGHLSQWTEV